MSRGNAGVVEEAVEALNRGDIEAALLVVDDDVVWVPQRSVVEGAYRGHEGVRRWFAQTQQTFEVFEWDLRETLDLGDRIVAIGSVHIRGRSSAVETDIPFAGIGWYEHGKLVRWEDFGERRLALEAAGLRE